MAAWADMARLHRSRVIRFLCGRLYSTDQSEKHAAATALGSIMGDRELVDEAKARDTLRRFFWALSEESGAVPFGAPEAIGEILARRPELQEDFLPVLLSMLYTEELFQTGAIELGLLWALARIGPSPSGFPTTARKALRKMAESHPDPEARYRASQILAG